jgi:hypothetical protein
MNKRPAFFHWIWVLFLAGCMHQFPGDIDNAGTASEVEGKYAIKGTAVDESGDPVDGAIVRIRPNGFLALYKSNFSAFDTVTDERGRFYFDSVAADSYTIEINKYGLYGALQPMSRGEKDTFPMILPATTLTPTGSIAGRINLPISDDSSRPFVALYNVDHLQKMPFTQDFRFDGVPRGVYSLQIVPSLGSKLVVELHDIEVIGDSVIDIGQLNIFSVDFFKGCVSRECDSTAVRSILDANGLAGVSVASVAAFDPAGGRITGLDLSNRSIHTVTKDIGSLSQLSSLDLHDNRIASLPLQMGYLQKLQTCRLDSNEISELPYELCFLGALRLLSIRCNRVSQIQSSLLRLPLATLDLGSNRLRKLPEASPMLPGIRGLYLDDNQLESIPEGLLRAKPEDFSIDGNRLCKVPESLGRWLSLYDGGWPESQQCQ